MYKYPYHPAFDGHLLTKEVKIDEFMKEFRKSYSLFDIREYLWKLAEAAVTHPEYFHEDNYRQNILSFLRDLEEFIEVAYLQKL